MIGLLLSRKFLFWLYRADVPANIFSPIIGLLILDRRFGYHQSTNLRFIKARPIFSLSFIHRRSIFNMGAVLVGPSFIDQSSLPQFWTGNQATIDRSIFYLLKLRQTGGDQNLEQRNVERPVFRNFEISNIKIKKDELFDNFIFELFFSFFGNYLNTQNIFFFWYCKILIFRMVKFKKFLNTPNC